MDTSHSTDLLLSDLTVLQASDKSDNAFFKVLYRIYFIFYRYQSFGRSIAIRPDGSGATDIKFNLPGRRAICFLGSQTFPSKHLFLYSSMLAGVLFLRRCSTLWFAKFFIFWFLRMWCAILLNPSVSELLPKRTVWVFLWWCQGFGPMEFRCFHGIHP